MIDLTREENDDRQQQRRVRMRGGEEIDALSEDEVAPTTVAPSTIPGAGMGLFADALIRKGEVAAIYKGTLHWERDKPPDSGYMARAGEGRLIDGVGKIAKGSYVNDASMGGGKQTNLKWVFQRRLQPDRIYMVATHTIQAGEELFIKYGAAHHTRYEQNVWDG